MPGKSGVGGGVVAIIPGKLSIAVWSPELNEHGNSYMGIETLERFTTNTGISYFFNKIIIPHGWVSLY